MNIAVQGLGRMGMQIAHKLADGGHTVLVNNRSSGPMEEAAVFGAIIAPTKQDILNSFAGEPVAVWIMLPAEIVDEQIDEWLTLLPKGSVIIDGGNSDFRKTQLRNKKVAEKSIVLIDVGTSGGIWGYQNGFSMMVGCDKPEAVQALDTVFQSLAAPEGAYHYFGESGSGHYVKMVHNAIEYGMMESLAEGYRMLKDGPYSNIDLSAAGNVWQHHSVITSWLNELCRDALKENPALEGIDGFVAESGEARWTIETAKALGIPLPSIESAFDVRLKSQRGETSFATQLLAAMRNKFGGHNLNKE